MFPGRTITAGYYKDPETTARTIVDGWLHTGDNGYADEDGYLYFFDRKKDVIKRAGENVSASEVEVALLEHPAVRIAAVIGVPDPIRDEAVKAFVVLADGETVSEEEIVEHCRDRLAPFKVPTIVEFRDSLPLTSVGKVEKKLLRAEAAAMPAGGLVTGSRCPPRRALDRTAVLTLNRPEAGNALSLELLTVLRDAIRGADRDDAIEVVVLTGADPAFCVGLELSELVSPERRRPMARAVFASSRPWEPTAKPVIGAINGPAERGGFELALACDVLIASERASFADTHASLGLVPALGLTALLPQAVGSGLGPAAEPHG